MLKVGDVFTHVRWEPDNYEVLEIICDTPYNRVYKVKNLLTTNILLWNVAESILNTIKILSNNQDTGDKISAKVALMWKRQNYVSKKQAVS